MNLIHLESERLKYRPFTEEDYNQLLEILHNEKVCEYLPGVEKYSKEQVRKWLNFFVKSFLPEKPNMYYAISLKENPKIIGYCGMNWIPEFETNEITYVIHNDYWGVGYASEIAKKMMEVARACKVKEMVSLAMVGNIPSAKVLEKVGFVFEKEVELWGAKLNLYRQTL